MILPSRATLIGYGVLLLVALSALGFGGCEHHNAAAARDDRNKMEQQREQARLDTKTATAANATNLKTIEDLRAANAQWAKLQKTPREVETALAQLDVMNARAAALAADLAKAKEKDSANPECRALLATDFERVCPLVAGSLRKSASSYGDGKRRDQDASVSAARP